MALSNADRQRAWRERHRPDPEAVADPKAERDALAVAQQRILALEAEVRHLKSELSRRSFPPIHQFGSPSPAPKPSRSRTSERGRAG